MTRPRRMLVAGLIVGALMCFGGKGDSAAAAADKHGAELHFSVTPAAPGRQLVRASLPLPRGFLREGHTLVACRGERETTTALRPLTWHPERDRAGRSVRRALVTFPYDFTNGEPVRFALKAVPASAREAPRLPVKVRVYGDTVTVAYRDGPRLTARLLAPARMSDEQSGTETVESNGYFMWQRTRVPDSQWPRVIEVRADALGGVVVIAHLQRNIEGDGRAPDFGWEIEVETSSATLREGDVEAPVADDTRSHAFADGAQCTTLFGDGAYRLYHPKAPLKRRGRVEVRRDDGRLTHRYWRCTAEEQVPMQQAAWRRAEFVVAPAGLAPLTAALQVPHEVAVDWRLWDELYETGPPLELNGKHELAGLLRYHRDAMVRSAAVGDDCGNVTAYSDASPTGAVFGMNRLNHCPAIFEDAWRSGERRLLETALLWCDNFYDQSIWWGPGETGGTRYNNLIAMGGSPPDDDRTYMWRSNRAVNFCTKGFDAFLLAFEETGDPRMLEALEAQVRYASEHVHADTGEARNVGMVRDFIRLYEYTGESRYLDQALRLFRELRTKLSPGDLFSQSGDPIVPDPPFIDDDATGYRHPFAKPYIIGYALAGLPGLLRYAPDEPRLRDVVQAVADFLAESQDPIGGWRYPHPRSSYVIMSQAMEHAWQIMQADAALGVQDEHLDAIERVLRQRVQGWRATGKAFNGLSGWEIATGKAKGRGELEQVYRRPGDRDFRRDYTEGQPDFGSSPPEGLVSFPEVLRFYLRHRPASRLLRVARDDEPLGQALSRVSGESR